LILDSPIVPGAQVQARRGSPKYPQGHEFMAALKSKASQSTHPDDLCINGALAAAGANT
jgi:hypothetical protein